MEILLKILFKWIAILNIGHIVLGASLGNTKSLYEDVDYWKETVPQSQYRPHFRSSYVFPLHKKNRQIYTSKTYYGSSQFQGLTRRFSNSDQERIWRSFKDKSHYQPYYVTEDPTSNVDGQGIRRIPGFPTAKYPVPSVSNGYEQISKEISSFPAVEYPGEESHFSNADPISNFHGVENTDQGVNVWNKDDQVSRGTSDISSVEYPDQGTHASNEDYVSKEISGFSEAEYPDQGSNNWNEDHHVSKEISDYHDSEYPDQGAHVSNEDQVSEEMVASSDADYPEQNPHLSKEDDQVYRGISGFPVAEYPNQGQNVWDKEQVTRGTSDSPDAEYPDRNLHVSNEDTVSKDISALPEAEYPDQGSHGSNEDKVFGGILGSHNAEYRTQIPHVRNEDDQAYKEVSDFPVAEYPNQGQNVWNKDDQIIKGISDFPDVEYADRDLHVSNEGDQVSTGISDLSEVEYPDQSSHVLNEDEISKGTLSFPEAEYPDQGPPALNEDYHAVQEPDIDHDVLNVGEHEIIITSDPHLDLDPDESEYFSYEDFQVEHETDIVPEFVEQNKTEIMNQIKKFPELLISNLTENRDESILVNDNANLNSLPKEGFDMINSDDPGFHKDEAANVENLSVLSEFNSTHEVSTGEDWFQMESFSENPAITLGSFSVPGFNQLHEEAGTSLMDTFDGSGDLDDSSDEPLHDELLHDELLHEPLHDESLHDEPLHDEPSKSGRIIFPRGNSTAECITPKGENGHCRSYNQCPLSETRSPVLFLQYMCLIRGIIVGVCCPNNPVIEISDNAEDSTTLKEIKQPSEGCGLSSNTRIVGGKVSVPHEWKWMVALMRRNRFFCGGVIINDWYILTAAHCVMGIPLKDLTVRLGEHNFLEKNGHQQDIQVAEIKHHAMFVTLTFQHDIALLRMKRRIKYTKFIGSICLPNEGRGDFSNENATVVGWGTVSFGGAASPVLRQVTVPVWDNEDCDRTYLFERITDSFLCAGSAEDGEDACQGDSGGPLMKMNNEGRWEVIGIVSWGRRCGDPRYPGVYTRITSYLDWIAENVK